MTQEPAVNINPFGMVFRSLYETVNGITQIVGLTPLELAIGFGGLIGVILVTQLLLSLFNKRPWTLDEPAPPVAVKE